MAYELSDAERVIIERAWTDARWFTDYWLNGWLFDNRIATPWQLDMHHAPQGDLTAIGGFGCGKTVAFGISYLVRCATIPYYKFLNVAPVAWQSKQMWSSIKQTLIGTRMSDFMVVKMVERPYPKIVIANDYVGESTMEFMSADKQGDKILSWEGDAIHIDECGLIQDLEDLSRNLASRLRGTLRHKNLWNKKQWEERPREARFSMSSNAWENPYMWWRLDMADKEPNYYWGKLLSTYDNENLTGDQIRKLEGKITSKEDRDRWLKGHRPKGIGDQFSAEMIEKCLDESLVSITKEAIEKDLEGYALREADKVGVWNWELPADKDRIYMVIGDPGQGNPPYRNAPSIGVFDITDFPKGPAVMRAFWWGFGRGSYQPFVSQMWQYAATYKSTDLAFDSTGTQKMMDELVFERDGLPVVGMNLAGMKMAFNTALKLFMDKELIKLPDLSGIRAQLGNYKLPDTGIPQDIVSMLQMASGYLRKFYYVDQNKEDDEDNGLGRDDGFGRYARKMGGRYQRSSRR